MNKTSFIFSALILAGISTNNYANIVEPSPLPSFSGNYLRVQPSVRDATVSSGSNGAIGFQYDPTGSGNNFINILNPAAPYENFFVKADQITQGAGTSGHLAGNNNAPGNLDLIFPALSSSFIDLSSGSTNHFQWHGLYAETNFSVLGSPVISIFSITNDYSFDTNGQRIDVITTITALTDLTNLSFLRSANPDDFGSGVTDTQNTLDANNASGTDSVSGITLTLRSESNAINHGTGISFDSINPSDYLGNVNDGNGDNIIGLAFNIGSLASGQSVSLNYAYLFSTASISVPIPAAIWLFSPALFGLVRLHRNRKTI
ncbi:MAG: hypothetical protein WC782_04985 [Methylococcaceae bacterium]|jgi:hypothetical protein